MEVDQGSCLADPEIAAIADFCYFTSSYDVCNDVELECLAVVTVGGVDHVGTCDYLQELLLGDNTTDETEENTEEATEENTEEVTEETTEEATEETTEEATEENTEETTEENTEETTEEVTEETTEEVTEEETAADDAEEDLLVTLSAVGNREEH